MTASGRSIEQASDDHQLPPELDFIPHADPGKRNADAERSRVLHAIIERPLFPSGRTSGAQIASAPRLPKLDDRTRLGPATTPGPSALTLALTLLAESLIHPDREADSLVECRGKRRLSVAVEMKLFIKLDRYVVELKVPRANLDPRCALLPTKRGIDLVHKCEQSGVIEVACSRTSVRALARAKARGPDEVA
jgi:hypothetical protein